MKNCELCKVPARTYCESDQASLCWNCDAKVHGANFLVARHSRTLLCHSCHSQTPWKASGSKLGHTVSVCESCVRGTGNKEEERQSEGGNDVDLRQDDDDNEVDDIFNDHDFDDASDEEEEEEEEEEEADNQVVPLSTTLPPPSTSSSSSEEVSVTTLSLKRMRENSSDLRDPRVMDDLGFFSFKRGNDAALTAQAGDGDGEATSLRPWKDRAVQVDGGAASSSAMIKSMRRIRGRDLCDQSKESVAVDEDPSNSVS
ncbi:zinc finger protein CONSTANS-LIKE 4-like isoform X2 [Juglans microcarpa x Juglans regia]|uniref:zinc finger protein CONSTANS-LIKE 4-like isoform X2 n=1 Tax=Juglans microcarpa x Juglans regia TaxID=2249226 RepID=UPI001B7F6A7A|nr:zinc finger protein CONSTANS-LIKE 4-like isoform X2 [Juglans microcarpa x Juglans regia]